MWVNIMAMKANRFGLLTLPPGDETKPRHRAILKALRTEKNTTQRFTLAP